MDELGTECPPGIGLVAKRELAQHGFTRYEHLATVSARELLAMHGVGPKAVRILREELARRGLSLRDDA